jgi:hypothetical protein
MANFEAHHAAGTLLTKGLMVACASVANLIALSNGAGTPNSSDSINLSVLGSHFGLNTRVRPSLTLKLCCRFLLSIRVIPAKAGIQRATMFRSRTSIVAAWTSELELFPIKWKHRHRERNLG